MKTVSFYHKDTGIFHGNQFIGTDDATVALNTPPDHVAIDGHHDPLSKRVNLDAHRQIVAIEAEIETVQDRAQRQAELDALKALLLVDYQPPAPSTDHEWDA